MQLVQVCALNGKVLYIDSKAAKVMQYNPDDNSARALVGSDHNSSSDGTQDSCSFKQLEGIFLGILGSLYDTFGTHSKGMKPEGVSIKQEKENVTKIDNCASKRCCEQGEGTPPVERDFCNLWSIGNCIKHVFAYKGWTGYTGM